jgi:hypothetical protein
MAQMSCRQRVPSTADAPDSTTVVVAAITSIPIFGFYLMSVLHRLAAIYENVMELLAFRGHSSQ